MFTSKVLDSVLIVVLAAIALCAFMSIRAARASGNPDSIQGYHHQHHHDALHHFYLKLMRPDLPTKVSCCNKHDCTPTQARKTAAGTWQAMKAGRWVDIPPQKVNREESVDTQAHICWYPHSINNDDVLCFVPPTSGL